MLRDVAQVAIPGDEVRLSLVQVQYKSWTRLRIKTTTPMTAKTRKVLSVYTLLLQSGSSSIEMAGILMGRLRRPRESIWIGGRPRDLGRLRGARGSEVFG